MDIYLDFDGVICDSFEECCFSSWLAWTEKTITENPPDAPPWDSRYLSNFRSCRPFIRSGEDYVVLHDCLSNGFHPRSQKEFDSLLQQAGQAKLAVFKDRLYSVREDLLKFHKGLWLSWNPLYPGFEELLKALSATPKVYILSTKKASFISEILAFNGITWPRERIFYTGGKKKISLIDQNSGFSPSFLLDDQIDHLDFEHPHCDCRLALWGFVKEEWITPQIPAMSLESALALLWSYAS